MLFQRTDNPRQLFMNTDQLEIDYLDTQCLELFNYQLEVEQIIFQ